MSDIKQQFQIAGVSKFVAKAEHLYLHWPTLTVRTKFLQEMIAEGMDRVLRSINYLVGERPDSRHRGAVCTNRLGQVLSVSGRVRPAGFAEPMLQGFIRRFKKQDKHIQPAVSKGGELLAEIGKKSSLANVNY